MSEAQGKAIVVVRIKERPVMMEHAKVFSLQMSMLRRCIKLQGLWGLVVRRQSPLFAWRIVLGTSASSHPFLWTSARQTLHIWSSI